jgi:hypothetical protein
MPFSLAHPPYQPGDTPPPETRPEKLAAWLQGLSATDAPRRAAEMAGSLRSLNRVPLSPKTRREIVDLFRDRAAPLWPELENALHAATHPLGGEALETATAAIGLASELNIATKRCLSDETARSLARGRDVPALVGRSQLAAGRTLSMCYLAYAPVPAGTWHDLHEIFQLALERGLAKTPVLAGSPSPELAYVQTLMLALANPLGLLPGQLPLVLDIIAEYCEFAVLTAEAPVHRNAKSVSIVPVGYDFPPFAASKGGSAEGEPMYLSTFEVAFRLQERLQAIERGADLPPRCGSGPRARMRYTALLRKLLRQWGDPPTRQAARTPGHAAVAACFGTNLVWQVTKSVNERAGAGAPAGDQATLRRCRVKNHTPGGYALHLQGETGDSVSIRVGEVIGLRSRDPERWQIAAVRWFRNLLSERALEFGCEILSDAAEAVAVRLEGAAPQTAWLPALHVRSATGEVSLLLPAGAFETESAINLRLGRHQQTVVLTTAIEQTPAYERYGYVAVG